jgi:hypothetical protein
MTLGGGTSLNLYLDSGSSGNYGNHVFRKVGWDGSQKVVAEKMRLDVDGKLGIGTSAPSQTLTVNGNADVSGTVKVAGTGDEACGPALRGTIRQNPVTRKLEICRY